MGKSRSATTCRTKKDRTIAGRCCDPPPWVCVRISFTTTAFGEEIEFEEKGQPTDFGSAKRLAELDKFQFQHWALSLIGARPLKEGGGKGADRGVDGLLYFYETERKDLLNRIREDAPSMKKEPVH